MNTQKTLTVFTSLALLLALCGGGYFAYQNYQHKQAELALKRAQEAEALLQAQQQRIALLKQFEDFLNGFLQEVAQSVQNYKTERSVLKELIKPENLREQDYIEENARLAENTVMSLQLQMEEIMGTFKTADERAAPLIAQLKDEEERQNVEAKWAQVRDENAQKLMGFFASEQDLLKAHLDLMEFYNANRDLARVDVANEHILFDDITLQEQEALLRGRIIELKAMQDDAL